MTRADRVVARRDEVDDAHAGGIGKRREQRSARMRLLVGERLRPSGAQQSIRGNSRIDGRQYIDQRRYVKVSRGSPGLRGDNKKWRPEAWLGGSSES